MAESLKKIIYFDETSAIDLLQIEKKGNFNQTIELVNETEGNLEGEAKITAAAGKQSAVKTVFERLTGFSGSAEGQVGISGTMHGGRIAKTLLENTLLYDFLDTVEFRKRKPLIDIVDDYKLTIDKESMTYFAMIAPITEMMEGQQRVDEEISMTVSKMNQGIKNTKGYYELIGTKASLEKDSDNSNLDKRIFRFNIDSFKNNYRIQDLRKMNLNLYSIYVGETRMSELKFENEFDLESDKTEIDFLGFSDEPEKKDDKPDEVVPVYDVILAGVK
ncbi:DUF6414 family protein [Vagococcus fluvialis]|uniref:DUF6414 family protein n=1 Tax=Vagococcus fluvialis TaxID=2738 RepID=UPI0028927A4D|nr:DUF6414 family protein [Vagococcus fluvialis]MDT2782826.1 DUF6414 family protein [Vagococcus fluvialis]